MLTTVIARTLSGSLVAAALIATGAIGATVVQPHATTAAPAEDLAAAMASATTAPATWTMPSPSAMPVASHPPAPTAAPAATPDPTPRATRSPRPTHHATQAPARHTTRHATATRHPASTSPHRGSRSGDSHSGGHHGDCWH